VSPRLPFLALVGLVLSGAVLASREGGPADVAAAAADPFAVARPATEPTARTWFCVGGTAQRGSFADHTVIVANAGPAPVTARVTVVPGTVAPAPEAPAASTTTTSSTPAARRSPAATRRTADGATADGAVSSPSSGAVARAAAAGVAGHSSSSRSSGTAAREPVAGVSGRGSVSSRSSGTAARESAVGVSGRGSASSTSSGTAARTAATKVVGRTGSSAGGAAATGALAGVVGGKDVGVVERELRVGAGRQVRLRLGDLVGAPLAAATVETSRGVVAVEHEVSGKHGTDRTACTQDSAATWHFAWGATTRDARELLVLYNPFANDVAVDATFSTDRGIRQPLRWQGLLVPARSLVGIRIGDDVTRRGHVAVTLRAKGGSLLVDRLQGFDGALGTAGLDVAGGESAPRTTWVFPDGVVARGAAERVVLYNPGAETAEVDVSVLGGPSDRPAPEPFGVVVRPGRYEVLNLDGQRRVVPNVRHAVEVRSRNGVPVVAERLVGRNRTVQARPATSAASRGWVLVAQTGGRVAVVNPDPDHPATVDVTMLVDGEPVRAPGLRGVEVPPAGRAELPLPARGPKPRPATVTVVSDRPVVAQPTG